MTLLMFIAGLVALIAGAEFLVRGASKLALSFGISPLVVGLTIVAFGTSAPEVAVSVGAVMDGRTDIALGNVVGSNLLNQLVILGLCATLSGQGLEVDPLMIARDFPIMVLTTLACLPIFWTDGVISRLEGGILLALYGLYLGEQLLLNQAPNVVDEYRLVVLVVGVPLLLAFLIWSVLQWRQQRRQLTLPGS